MARGRVEANWEPIRWLLALTFNLNRDAKKTKAVAPDQFGPQKKRRRRRPPRGESAKENVQALKIFLKPTRG
ncbi:MAG: hypothetical protein QM811_16895 [Pirellulales bacterium]